MHRNKIEVYLHFVWATWEDFNPHKISDYEFLNL